MIKRYYNEPTYIIKGNKGKYLVTLERLNNTPSGNPRYKARITPINDKEYNNTYVYMFHSTYGGEKADCEHIVQRMENDF